MNILLFIRLIGDLYRTLWDLEKVLSLIRLLYQMTNELNYELYLTYPPTINNYYVKTTRGVYISQKGRKFRAATAEAVNQQLPEVGLSGRLLVEIVLYPPDRRKRDIDNCNKAILDALTQTGIWEDDSQIDQLFVYRGNRHSPNGSCFVRITDAGPLLPVGVTPD